MLSALWGKLAAEILMQQWEVALDDLTKLKEIVDANSFAPILVQLQQRVWLMHWALFVFFEHENGRNAIIDLFFQDRCVFLTSLSSFQRVCPTGPRRCCTAPTTAWSLCHAHATLGRSVHSRPQRKCLTVFLSVLKHALHTD